MLTKKNLIISVVAIIVLGWLAWSQMKPDLLPVWVVTVERGSVEASIANTRAGTVKACRRSKLSMPIGGVVDKLLVDEGDKVETDQLLLELWNQDRAADVSQAKQALLALESERDSTCLMAQLKSREARRLEKLESAKLASEESLDNAITAEKTQQQHCRAAENQVGVARARLEFQLAVFARTQLRAPFAGVVAEINGEIGEYITPSPQGIATPAAIDLIDYSCLYITAPIDEVDAARVRVGQPARVTLDAYRGETLMGTVMRISPYVLDLEKQARTVDVDVQLESVPETMTLLVGYSADITIIQDSRDDALRLPSEAILADGSVWLVDEFDQLRRKKVQTGIGNWTFTQVTGGLNEGDRIVRNPDKAEIAEGVTVSIEASAGND